ncbi:MAG TPA: ankyrin repeat domain-containing protein, partial [Gammaproteobacteria bacterium]|nr:ankyrin repeat domain-containing protein [Gammaproteobacteria bacterium]
MLNWPHILDVNRQDQNGMSPVHYAIIQKNFEELQKLTNVPCVFVNLADKDNKMPLHYAIESNFIEAIALLLEKGADLHAKDKYGNSILHYVAAFGTTETIRLILKNKPNVVSNHMGLKPLDFAIHCNNFNFLYYANENLENPACRILPVNERRVKISAYLNFIKLFWEGLAENSPKKHYLTLDDKITFFTLNKIIDHCLLSTRTFLSSSIPQFWQPLYNKSKENELSLRKALNTMHRGVSEQLKVLQIAHLEYTSNYIQPIQVVINRFGNIPIPYNASTVHSWFFAFF